MIVAGRDAALARSLTHHASTRPLPTLLRRGVDEGWMARRPRSKPNRAIDEVDPAQGKIALERDGWRFLDLRSAKAYDDEHLTKPPRCSVNVPMPAEGPSALPEAAERAKVSKSGAWLVTDADGTYASAAAAALAEAGWSTVASVSGGYAGWRDVWTTSGRRVPPKGRWVSTGKEALKSGLNVGDAATSYEERLNVEDLSKAENKDFK